MRLLLAAPVLALAAACTPGPEPVQPLPPAVRPAPPPAAGIGLLGMSSQDLVRHLGTPARQFREGQSVKLQFRSRFCMLDAYLYPPAGQAAPLRVTHVETRTPALGPIDQAACIATLRGA